MAQTATPNLGWQNKFSTTLSSGITASDTTIPLTALPTPSEGFLVIEPDSSTAWEVIYYTSKTGSAVICPSAAAGRGQDDSTAQSHSSGATVRMDTTAGMFEVLQNGSALNAGALGSSPFATGWISSVLPAVSSVTYNGNHSYNITFASTVASYISASQRLRTTRTVAAPTQCTSLNGTTQYYSKTSPAGMTFTDDFVVSAWVKLSSYNGATNTIASRYNGTSGWNLSINSAGQVVIGGNNAGAANFSAGTSYQSIPLNKWVHIAAQLDMSAFTATTTTTYIMIDGVDVPLFVARGGTNPTALVQAGNLEIGAQNAGTLPFNGKIAQVAIYNAKVTQANVRATISQGLAGTETSLISAYSFNNSINDLSSNANNLTANGSAVATNADSPFGTQADATISSTLDYAIVQNVATTVATVQVPEGCSIPTTGGVASVDLSAWKAPYGMPVQMDKWELGLINLAALNTSGTVAGTVYNPGGLNINLPIGAWDVAGDLAYAVTPNAAIPDMTAGLQTSNSAFVAGQEKLTNRFISYAAASSNFTIMQFVFQDRVNLTAATPYYILLRNGTAMTTSQLRGAISTSIPEKSVVIAKLANL